MHLGITDSLAWPLRAGRLTDRRRGRPAVRFSLFFLDEHQGPFVHKVVELLHVVVQQGDAAPGPVHPHVVQGRVVGAVDADYFGGRR